jgi:hypothetical protein
MPTHNEISNIYDKQIRLQPPFQKFYEQEVWGGWRSHVWQYWGDQLIQEFSCEYGFDEVFMK